MNGCAGCGGGGCGHGHGGLLHGLLHGHGGYGGPGSTEAYVDGGAMAGVPRRKSRSSAPKACR